MPHQRQLREAQMPVAVAHQSEIARRQVDRDGAQLAGRH
jgi:hypothetical protein